MRTVTAFFATVLVTLTLTSAAHAQLRKETHGGLFGQTAVGNEEGVAITNVWDAADAFPIAEQFCQYYGRKAKFNRMDGYTASFECVKN